MNQPIKILLSSNNPGKVSIISNFAKNYGYQIYSPNQLGITEIEVEETGSTYEENALLKFNAYKDKVPDDFYILADDTGIEITALGGEPGIHSRRWNGTTMTDDEIIDYALLKMKNLEKDNRNAKFVSFIIFGKTDLPKTFVGELHGQLLEKSDTNFKPRPGLPFRQLFYVTEAGKMIDEYEKSGLLDHRQKALKKAFESI